VRDAGSARLDGYPDRMSDGRPVHARVLAAAVAGIGGHPREGQQAMADAVDRALHEGTHLVVQAGTGTGKSLAYLAPLLAWTHNTGNRAVVATATLALQHQLATQDIPAALEAAERVFGERPQTAVVKGRSNYACLLRVRDGVGVDQDPLIGGAETAAVVRAAGATAESVLGAEVVALREWVDRELEAGGLADRDDAPTHTARAWAQVSVPTRECVGAATCPYGEVCFVEESRARGRRADLVVTNHALLAVDATQGRSVLPDHAAVVIDEAHELVARVTSSATQELSPQMVERVAKRASRWLETDLAEAFTQAGVALADALDAAPVGRLQDAASPVVEACAVLAGAARRVVSALESDNPGDLEGAQAQGAVQEVFDVATRLAALSEADVVWISERERYGRQLVVAPLSVTDLMRRDIFGHCTGILTSATLKLGGGFGPLATSVGFAPAEQIMDPDATTPGSSSVIEVATRNDAVTERAVQETGTDEEAGDLVALPSALAWRGLDVGSPFDYGSQGICYIARGLPPPSRDGIGEATLAEVAELVWAAGGRTLGLFASQRAAEAAASHVRAQVPGVTVLCQGDANLPELTQRFREEPSTCLFGTLSLWQGVDLPGRTCQLVLIDKIPFPRPDDPLMQARQQAVTRAGGNGFMQVAATNAGLLLAQGAGRLIRRLDDRGVVAILDPRLVTARYGGFLRACLPGFWTTTDREVAVSALQRLHAQASESDSPAEPAVPPAGRTGATGRRRARG